MPNGTNLTVIRNASSSASRLRIKIICIPACGDAFDACL